VVLGVAAPVLLAAALGGGVSLADVRLVTGWGQETPEPMPVRPRRATLAEADQAATRSAGGVEEIGPSALVATPGDEDSLRPEGEVYLSQLAANRTRGLTYAEAYAGAQADLEEAFGLVDVRDFFAPRRLMTPDSIRAARRVVAAAANILADYHRQEVTLEQAYHPAGTDGLTVLRESFDEAEAGRAMLAATDSLFGLLLAQDGRYTLTERGVHFADASTTGRYSDLRTPIMAWLRATAPIARAGHGVGAQGRLRRVIGNEYPPPPVP